MEALYAALAQLPRKGSSYHTRFYRTGPGDYAQHDHFLGIPTPQLRQLASSYLHLHYNQLTPLLHSPYNEYRLFAYLILLGQYKLGTPQQQSAILDYYLRNRTQCNNWNLVDTTAPVIVGPFLQKRPCLWKLFDATSFWQRRIAITATLFWAYQGKLHLPLAGVTHLLTEKHRLVRRAMGWVLRTCACHDKGVICIFLRTHYTTMPPLVRTIAMEHFSEKEKMLVREGKG